MKWQDGETLSLAIGRGFNLVTPIQLCQMTATIANGGKRYLPQLVESVTDADGAVIESLTPKLESELQGDEKKYLALIREGMTEVVQGARGTLGQCGLKASMLVVRLARLKSCGWSNTNISRKDIPYKYRDHAWFTCFAPAEDPEIAVTVLVEHGLHGGSGAGPVAKAVLQKYFSDKVAVDKIRKAAQH